MSKPKMFRVRFVESTGYRIHVEAVDEDDAIAKAQDLFDRMGPEPSEGYDIDDTYEGGSDDWEATSIKHRDLATTRPTRVPVCLTENAYTYSPEHRHGKGWVLANDTPGQSYLTIQRVDTTNAFANDHEAAFHVICAATFDVGPEGTACRTALQEIIRFGQRGLNPIATMLVARRSNTTKSTKQ